MTNKVAKIVKLENEDWWRITMENGYIFTYQAAVQPFKVGEVVLFESDNDNLLKVKLRLIRPVDSHAHFYMYVNGALAGNLCFNKDEWEQMITDGILSVEVSEG